MFESKSDDPRPLGVPLDDLQDSLSRTSLNVRRDGSSLIVTHPEFATRVDVVPPASRESPTGPIKAVVQVRTDLPSELVPILSKPSAMATMNAMATTGALTSSDGKVYVGSRLTMYEAERAWSIQFPLILYSIVLGMSSLIGAMRRTLEGQPNDAAESAWVASDFEQVRQQLARSCTCTTGGLGLSAEFGLQTGAVSAASHDRGTALWQLLGNQPHPEVGGGLLCVLELPHAVADQSRLFNVLSELNRKEMAPHDLPPHFGAWCRGRTGNNPAYVSFLPNALHSATGIAVNMSYWALHRAHWAGATLGSMGIRI